MAHPSVIPAIRECFETYLHGCEVVYQQPEDTRKPTIPATPGGKVWTTPGRVESLSEAKPQTLRK